MVSLKELSRPVAQVELVVVHSEKLVFMDEE